MRSLREKRCSSVGSGVLQMGSNSGKSGFWCVFFAVLFTAAFVLSVGPLTVAQAADRLVVKDGGGSKTFKVEDDGRVLTQRVYQAQNEYCGFWLDETGTGFKGAYFVLDGKVLQLQRRAQNFGPFEASIFKIHLGAPTNAFTVAANGNVGFGVGNAGSPIVVSGGAYCTGTKWQDGSSKEYKENISSLNSDEALDALLGLDPVRFNYKTDKEDECLGFIAEDVPDLVASKDRKGMSSMDVVAVLTKVVQEQQKVIQDLSDRLNHLERQGR